MYTNEYDDDHFFSQYVGNDRSRGGLEAAEEWHQLKPLFPGPKGKRVLDLGCSFRLTAVEEAQPSEELLSLPGMADALRRPMMLLVRAEK